MQKSRKKRRWNGKEKKNWKERRKKPRWQQLLDENKRKFLDGEKITAEMFLEITGRDGFDIHIRTKGDIQQACDSNRQERNRQFPKIQRPPYSRLYRVP